MPKISFSLSPESKAYVDRQLRQGAHRNLSAYFESLIRFRQRSFTTSAELEALLIEGVESGPAKPLTAADWRDIRRELNEHIRGKSAKNRPRSSPSQARQA